MVAFAEPQSLELVLDWDCCVAQLAAEAPAWTPGTQHGESALFYGHLLGEIVRRIDGRSFGTYFREEIAGPFKIDIHIGVDDDIATRIANVEDPGEKWRMQMLEGASDLRRRALGNPVDLLVTDVLNSTRWRKAEIPGVNGHASARGLARLHGILALGGHINGVTLLGPKLFERDAQRPCARRGPGFWQ